MNEYIDIFKRVFKAVVIAGTISTIDSNLNSSCNTFKPSNSVDDVLRHIGSGSIGFIIGDKAADAIIKKAEEWYHAFEEARD